MINFPSSPLDDAELALRDEVRAFMVDYRKQGHPAQLGINAEPNIEFSKEISRRGWVGMSVPTEYGGHGRTAVDRFIVVEEMLAAGAPISAHWVGDRQTAQMLLKFGTEEQKHRFLPAIVNSEVFFCLGMSEPDSGSDLASVRTRATKTEGGWILNGQKVWTSGAHYADFAVSLCRTQPLTERKHIGLSQLIVDLKAEGVTVAPIRLLNGAHHFNEVFFDDVFVADEMLLGEPGDGWRQVTSELAHERSGPDRFLSVMPIVQRLYDELKEAKLDGAVRAELGLLFARYMTFRTMSLSIARRLDQGELPAVEAALVKDMGTQFENDAINAVRRIIDRQVDPVGDELDALLADAIVTAPTFTLRGGTNEVLRTVIAKDLIRNRGRAA
ncbi:alkylation response protein AidB-like acyl-CoA dehydrogenase [Nocardioides salarius]|uniref:Alkylation response protein AidB-like acyl-CoA dehydrogenase n=1 Tax=Nocardioides salarius TaxID=374513 RepID=A0ABS2MA69_9ACTN|nr:acyl-CoA dehydrogenase family protein [Nocardioides salarius]MBM7508070.1 alkylation response protein AidB-like acyl-CoA dehydrogenase [Nocardioides salarius]